MKIINNESNVRRGGAKEKKSARRGGAEAFPLRTRDIASEVLEVGRKTFKKLKDVEDLVEIIAREIKRQLDRQREQS